MEGLKPEPTQYRHSQGWILFVSSGISDGEDWMTVYVKPGKDGRYRSGSHRLKSPALPLRGTREDAQADLDRYAEKKGFVRI